MLVAVSILGVSFIALGGAVMTGLRSTMQMEKRNVVRNQALRYMERMQKLGFGDILDPSPLSTDLDERERLAESLGEGYAMILRNHGLLTVGRTIGEAFMLMHYLERACRVQIQVLSTGRAVSLPPEEVLDKAAKQYEAFWPGTYEWPALVRLVDKLDPSYRD